MAKRHATMLIMPLLLGVTMLGLSVERTTAAPVEAEMVNTATCRKDVRSDAATLAPATDAEAAAAEVLFGVRPAMQVSTTIVNPASEYNTTTTRYYEEKITKRKTTYRCVAERVQKDGRFSEPSHQYVEWYDEKGKRVLVITSYYEILSSLRPLVGVTLIVENYTVSLSPFDASTIGPLENWHEVDLATLSMQLQRATKRLVAGVARSFVLTNYVAGEPEMVDLLTGYVIGLQQTGLPVTLTDVEATDVQQHLLLKNSKGSILRTTEVRVLHNYSDFYLLPSLGWGGGHMTTHTEKNWVGETFATEKEKALGSHFTLTEVSPSTGIAEYWFTSKGQIR